MSSLIRPLALAGLATLGAILALAAPAQAQTFTVTSLSDSGASGDGSLRGELAAANANPGADTINFAAGLSGTITLSGNGLQITDPLDLEGPGPGQITVAQSSPNRVIHVNLSAPGAVTIAGLHIANGGAPNTGAYPTGDGADILSDTTNAIADLTIANSLITGGVAAEDGGGIESTSAPLTLRSSTVSGNQAQFAGGVEAGDGGAGFTIEASTISGNSAHAFGGVGVGESASVSGLIQDSTIAGNTSTANGGGVGMEVAAGSVAIRNSTISGNTAGADGAGLSLETEGSGSIAIEGSTVAANNAGGGGAGGIDLFVGGISDTAATGLEDTIVADNTTASGGPDISGPISAAFSLIGNPSGATITETVPGSDLLGADPRLGPLASNGGPAQTMALPPTSPAVDKGAAFGLATDQRGAHRPIDFPAFPNSTAPGADGSDIGAYELLPADGKLRIGKLKRNKLTLFLPIPDAGTVMLFGKHLKREHKTATASGKLTMKVIAKGKLRRSLRRKGHVEVKVKVTYTPQAGTPLTGSKRVKLIEQRRTR